jgi:hypothetical protein
VEEQSAVGFIVPATLEMQHQLDFPLTTSWNVAFRGSLHMTTAFFSAPL